MFGLGKDKKLFFEQVSLVVLCVSVCIYNNVTNKVLLCRVMLD